MTMKLVELTSGAAVGFSWPRYRTSASTSSSDHGLMVSGHTPVVSIPPSPGCDGVVKISGVCGGVACIERTRIPVWILNRLKQLGVSDAEILAQYPDLKPHDLVCAWAYVASHPSEINEAARQNGI